MIKKDFLRIWERLLANPARCLQDVDRSCWNKQSPYWIWVYNNLFGNSFYGREIYWNIRQKNSRMNCCRQRVNDKIFFLLKDVRGHCYSARFLRMSKPEVVTKSQPAKEKMETALVMFSWGFVCTFLNFYFYAKCVHVQKLGDLLLVKKLWGEKVFKML